MKTSIKIISLFIISIPILYCHTEGHKHGSANHHMHKRSTEDLIRMFESPERTAYQEPDKVLAYIGDLKGKKLMDIGSGSGYFSFRFAKKGANVVAADVQEEFLAYVKDRITKEDVSPGSVTQRKISYTDPFLNDKEMDIIFLCNVYHHIENRQEYFTKVKKGLSMGGKLVVVDFFKKDLPIGPPMDHKIDQETVKSELEKLGFKNIKLDEKLLKYQYIITAE
ncbi:MAG: methyltransferase domain-containing protein [Leptospiraceae bacterium]|nr:methyltransferase domain-containing protein [Leptospiraceae bacterium]MCP5510947.1 methyltransferase domain-containing protein [Leptospiraceae bacterium]